MMTDREIALFMDNPDWDMFIKPFDANKSLRSLPSHEDCSPIDVETTASHLLPSGTLGRGIKDYEVRTGQLDALRSVAHAFNNRQHLMIEAGTGVGKSLAYLIPSVQWSYLNDTPVVISTATKNLQDQLIRLDIPRAVSTISEEERDENPFKVSILKGRANYLCLRELDEMNHDGIYSLSNTQKDEFSVLVDWLYKTKTGDLDEFETEVAKNISSEAKVTLRPLLSCPSEECIGRRCKFYDKCFVNKARTEAKNANLIITNHSLVLTEANASTSDLLPAYGRLVFDEAHNVPDIATDIFTFRFSRATLLELVGKVERKSKRRGGNLTKGVLASIKRQLDKGALDKSKKAPVILELITKIRIAVGFLVSSGEILLGKCEAMFTPSSNGEVVRFRTIPEKNSDSSYNIRQHSFNGAFTSYLNHELDEAELQKALLDFESFLARTVDAMLLLREKMMEADEDHIIPLFGEINTQLLSISELLKSYLLNLKFLIAASDPSYVFWIEREWANQQNKRKKDTYEIVLQAAPLFVAEQMNSICYSIKDSVVMCSATLRVGDKFNYLAHRLGMDLVETERIKCLVASSPFDYTRQALVLFSSFLPKPDNNEYVAGLGNLISSLSKVTKGRMLVLFTSYEMMYSTADAVQAEMDKQGISLFVQGQSLSREGMVSLLKDALQEHPVVLFGAQSFWEGVDIPGDALSCVVIARVPFPQIKEPINEARMEAVKAEGKSDFKDYLIPESLVRFRQGIGRLIRKKTDRGIIVLADSRPATTNYGAIFRNAVPCPVHVMTNQDELISRADEFLNS